MSLKINSISFLIALITTSILVYVSLDNFYSKGNAYSSDLRLRYQTESFLLGRLSVADSPFNHEHDWGYSTHGAQSGWGLGVPLLRMPSEIIAKSLGFIGFPDRLWLAIFIFIVNFSLVRSLFALLEFNTKNIGLAFLSSTFIFNSIPILNFLHSRMVVYEEVIFVGFLWNVFLVSQLIYLLKNDSKKGKLFFTLSVAFSLLIRPTAFIPASILWVCFFVYKKNFKEFLFFGFILGNVILLELCVSNYLRFGSLLEFGYNLNLSYIARNDLSLRFGYPFENIDFYAASRELFGWLFLPYELRDGIYFDWVSCNFCSELSRFREFNFRIFSFTDFVLLLFSVISFVIILFKHGSFRKSSLIVTSGILSFAILFVFYSRSPAIISRYLLDFLPSFYLVIIPVFIVVINSIRNFYFSLSVITLLCSLVFGNVIIKDWEFPPRYRVTSTNDIENRVNNHIENRLNSSGKLPLAYICKKNLSNRGIPANLKGWNYQDCSAKEMITFFMDDTSCLKVDFETEENLEWKKIIKLKKDLRYMNLISLTSNSSQYQAVFCDTSVLDDKIHLYSMAFTDPKNPILHNVKLMKIVKDKFKPKLSYQ